MNTDTPRTECAVLEASQYYQPLYPSAKGRNQPVHAAFAREQELRIAQLERELAEAREASAVMQRHMNLARKVAGCADEETLVVTIEKLQSQCATQRAALEKAGEALESCRMVVQNEISIREMLGKPTRVWPDLLTGCVSGGGIEDALTTINAALEEKKRVYPLGIRC